VFSFSLSIKIYYMKSILSALFFTCILLSCNSPEQNSTVGNSQDSLTVKGQDTLSTSGGSTGAGVDNSGGATAGPGILTDTAPGKLDSLDKTSKRNKALKK
jgi:hypothetical protein